MKKIKYAGTDEYLYYEKLKNGLEIYMYPSSTARNFYLTFNTRFGSMDTDYKFEGEENFRSVPNGTAHFLEHQLFQENDGHTAFEYFASLGSSVNAFTTYNLTCYEVVASEYFANNLNTLLDFVQNPVFKADSVNSERGIIKEEIEMYDNNPSARSNFGIEYNININDNHKYTISGTIDDIKEITHDMLYDIHKTFYQPGNMFLVLTGNFKPLEAIGIIKENQKKKEFAKFKRIIRSKVTEPLKVFKEYEEIKMDVAIPKIKIAYKMSKRNFKDYSDLLTRIYLNAILSIKFGVTSDILESLTISNLITWNIITSSDIRDDYILITIGIESNYPDEVIALIREELTDIHITEEELMRLKRTNIANFILHFNDIISVAEDIQDDIINNNEITTDIMEIYENLNLDNINYIASKIDLTNESIHIVSSE